LFATEKRGSAAEGAGARRFYALNSTNPFSPMEEFVTLFAAMGSPRVNRDGEADGAFSIQWSMIFSENRFAPADQVRGHAFRIML
jgi:hypothetical protein